MVARGRATLKLSVIIPVFNEKETIREILARVRAVEIDKEIVVVDDCSTDGTELILAEEAGRGDLVVIRHAINQGKGAAVRSGLERFTGDLVVIQDGDLEYDPADYHTLLRPVLSGRARVVYGSRFLGEHKAMYFWHMVANKSLTLITNILFDTTLTDMETCYKLFAAEAVRGIRLRSNRWGFDPEITAKVLRRGYRIYEVPISYNGREFWEGKKISWRDGVSVLFTLLRYRLVD